MEKILLITNWIVYGLLFGTFFLKLTDNKERGFDRKVIYGLLMLYCLFMSVILFKNMAHVGEYIIVIKIGLYQTIFNILILYFMITKIKYDKIFKI